MRPGHPTTYRTAPDELGSVAVELAPHRPGILDAHAANLVFVVVFGGPTVIAGVLWFESREPRLLWAFLVGVAVTASLAVRAVVRRPGRSHRLRFYETGLEVDDGRGHTQRCRYDEIVAVHLHKDPQGIEARLVVELEAGQVIVPGLFDLTAVQGRLAVARRHLRLARPSDHAP